MLDSEIIDAISIIVIGKNEEKNLENLYKSLISIDLIKEVIYVDSASKDNSILISQNYCDFIYELEESPFLCASAGRYIGVKKAKYKWVLFLDGDMELEQEFIDFLNTKKLLFFEKKIAGFVGYYNYCYSDGTNFENRLLQPANKLVTHFGGAVLLNKYLVLEVGNWNPAVVANEEIDLYVRIQNLGYKVFGLDKNMVIHRAKKTNNLQTLKEVILPINRRYFGYGQVLVSQFRHKTLFLFLLKNPFPLIYLILFLLMPFFSFLIILIILFMFYVTVKKKWYYNIIYISDLFRGLAGVLTYSNYKPKFKNHIWK
jgi:glycosyltransferase involved in cell wall biosynthesis